MSTYIVLQDVGPFRKDEIIKTSESGFFIGDIYFEYNNKKYFLKIK